VERLASGGCGLLHPERLAGLGTLLIPATPQRPVLARLPNRCAWRPRCCSCCDRADRGSAW